MSILHQNKPNQPFHVSVGAVVINDKGKIRVHKRVPGTTPPEWLFTLGGLKESYTLMRETVENGEVLEEAVLRGVREEFGIEGEIRKYLGSIQAHLVNGKGMHWEKTTLYYLVAMKEEHERHADDGESHTELVWADADFLMEKMGEQGKATKREDLDESKILRAYLEYGKL